MTDQERIAVAHQGLLLAYSPILKYSAEGRQNEVEGVVLTSWGPHGPALNKVKVVGPAPSLARILELADVFFGPDSGGYGVVVEADAGHPVEHELRSAGWVVFEDEPALVLSPIPEIPLPPNGLEIRPVRDSESRYDLLRVLASGFGEPTAEGMPDLSPEAFDSMCPSVACATDPDVSLLVGYCNRQPASSAFLFKVGDIAGVTGVATVPAYRRRGFGIAVTWAAIREGTARGCCHATLAAQGASYDMYRKMGFVRVCNHRAYAAPGKPGAAESIVKPDPTP